MENIIKDAIKVGNSAGILLPKSWQGCKVKAILLEKPLNIKGDLLKILEPYLQKVLGIYMVGSYARNEASKKSDIDILVINEGINKEIYVNRYHITLMDINLIREGNSKYMLYILALIKEARALLNESLLRELKGLRLDRKGLKWHLETSRSALKLIRSFIKFDEDREILSSIGLIYSLILRIKEAYIADCLINNRNYKTKDLLRILSNKIGKESARIIYETYRALREEKQVKRRIKLNIIKRLVELLEEMLKKQEEWAKERKD